MNPLQGLHDIAVPDAVNAWPLAWGWWLLISLILISLVVIWIATLKHKRLHAPRKQAIKELKHKQDINQLTLSEANTLLKRIAISYSGRQETAAMHGKIWVAFLQSHLKKSKKDASWYQDLALFAESPYRKDDDINPDVIYSVTLQWLSAVNVKSLKLARKEVSGV